MMRSVPSFAQRHPAAGGRAPVSPGDLLVRCLTLIPGVMTDAADPGLSPFRRDSVAVSGSALLGRRSSLDDAISVATECSVVGRPPRDSGGRGPGSLLEEYLAKLRGERGRVVAGRPLVSSEAA